MEEHNKYIALAGAKNFRDFGGYRTMDGRKVRAGYLFRSDGLSALTDEDLAIIQKLNIKHVFDLRLNKERTLAPSRWYPGSDTQMHHFSLISDQASRKASSVLLAIKPENNADSAKQLMVKTYRNLVSAPHALAQLGSLMQQLANNESAPVLFHCTGGKDRTGVTCALLLALLGVGRDDIFTDYLDSQRYYSNQAQGAGKLSTQFFDLDESAQIARGTLLSIQTVDADYLQAAFDEIENNYVSIAEFFTEALGVTPEHVDQLRNSLVV